MENNNNFFERDHEETEKRNSTKIKMEIDQEFLRKTKKLFGLTLVACGILIVFNTWGLIGIIMILLIKRIWNSL